MNLKNNVPIVSLEQKRVDKVLFQKTEMFDFLCVLEGCVDIAAEDSPYQKYQADSILILHPKNGYFVKGDGENQILVVSMEPSFIEKYIGTDYIIFCDSAAEPNRNYSKIKNILTAIAVQYTNNMALHELSVYALVFQLLDLIKREFTLHMSNVDREKVNHRQELRVHEIQEYVRKNYKQDISLSTLAKYLNLSTQYLSKIFNEFFKLHFNQYVNSYRVMMAERELKFSDKSITDIALNNGFQNITLFNKYFRSMFKVSPKEYKAKYTIENVKNADRPDKERVPALLKENNQESRIISINAESSNPFPKNLCRMINIGIAKKLLQEDFQKQTSNAHKELGFEYVRIQWLVSNAMIPKLVENDVYYFVFVENCLDYLYREKLIPFIELSRSTERYEGKESTWNGILHSVNAKFLSLFEAFLKFVISHYDSEWYEKWVFELQKPAGETIDSFMQGFSKVQELVKKYIPGARVGGPGHNIAFPPETFTELLQNFKLNGIRPDYISIHCFTMQYLSGQNECGKLCVYEAEELPLMQKWIDLQIRHVLQYECPMYITELNSSLIPNTYINHSCYQAAFLCQSLLSMYTRSQMIGYWGLHDTALTPDKKTGLSTDGFALINRNGIQMPGYFAYLLLNRLGKELVELGDGYCVTKKDDEHYQILLFYYVSFSNYSFLTKENSQPLENVYKEYKDVRSQNVTCRLENIPNGIYRVRKHLLDQYHGSYVDLRIRELLNSDITEEDFMIRTMTPAPDEMEYFRTCCVPEESTSYISAEGSLELYLKINPHDVCLWEISKEI